MAFNLSKNNDPVPEKERNVWVVGVSAVLLIGGAAWYFIPKQEKAVIKTDDAASSPLSANVPEATAMGMDTAAVVAGAVPVSAAVDTAISASSAAIPARIAASFNKGTATPVTISDEIVNEIKKGHKVTIYGYASSEGELSINLKLAAERAAVFKQYLISRGVDEEMIMAVGKGIDNPIATNDTESGRARNRRVEVRID